MQYIPLSLAGLLPLIDGSDSSLPELATPVIIARKKNAGIAIGNVIVS